MTLNKQKGNMYGFVTHTWNAIKGKCSHGCKYCYMIPFWRSEVHLDEKELKTDLGEGNFIFVGSGTDMFAKNVPDRWIDIVFNRTDKFPKNTYLFQTKNPRRFIDLNMEVPNNFILGITLETNRENDLGNAPKRLLRVMSMASSSMGKIRKMITIEPIMDFDLGVLVNWIKRVKPEFVNIGADSKGHKLPEPSPEKIKELIKELEEFTKVNQKDNLKRLLTHK